MTAAPALSLRMALAIALCAILSLLVLLHTPYLNGPPYWQWAWRRLPAVTSYAFMLAAAMPVLLGIALWMLSRQRTSLALVALMAGVLAMKLTYSAVIAPPDGTRFIADIVRSREATSYFIDAAALTNYPGWFSAYDEVLPRTGLHTRSKPPGPLLYWTAFIHLFGYTDRAAIVGGITLGVLAMFAIPMTWWLVKLLTGARDAAFLAAAMLALCPGFVLFFPVFDPAYIVLSCAMIGLWHLTVARDSYWLGACFALVLVAATFIAYPLLSLGLFLFLHGLLNTPRRPREALMITLRQSVVVLLVVAAFYGALWFFTAYDPIATFQSAWANQQRFLARHEAARQWPMTIPWDLLDFALSAAWLPAVLAAMFLMRTTRTDERAGNHRLLVILCLAQPVMVALSGLVQTETARVWNFMLPLLLLPAALELRCWSRREQFIFYACMWLLLTVVGQNMMFLNPG